MTDEQWTWLYVNWRMDNDEQLERMCPKCREEAKDNSKCTRCGTKIADDNTFVNPNFDPSRFEKLSKG